MERNHFKEIGILSTELLKVTNIHVKYVHDKEDKLSDTHFFLES